MLLNPLTYHSPATPLEAVRLVAGLENVRILAGGTFLLNNLKMLKKRGLKSPQNVVSLRKIPALKEISLDGDSLNIGSMATINDLLHYTELPEHLGILRKVCKNISTNPIRNMATVGGNLSSRYTWTELGAVFIALEAKLHFLGPDGRIETRSVEEFFAGGAKTGKLLVQVSVKPDREWRFAYERVKKLSSVDVPMLALCLRAKCENDAIQDARVVVNNATHFAQRDTVLEDYLNGRKTSASLPDDALGHLDTAIYDSRSSEYKRHMFRVSLKKALKELISRGEAK